MVIVYNGKPYTLMYKDLGESVIFEINGRQFRYWLDQGQRLESGPVRPEVVSEKAHEAIFQYESEVV